jgi:hypothetical protein
MCLRSERQDFDFERACGTLKGRKNILFTTMTTIIETVKKYKAEIVLVGLYIYVIILGIATLKELGIF